MCFTVRSNYSGDHFLIILLEIPLLVSMIMDVDIRWVYFEIGVRVVPPYDLLACGLDFLVCEDS